MPTFKEFCDVRALQDKLPFGLDFEIKPVSNGVSEEVAGLTFGILNDLTARESWFFETLESLNDKRVSDLRASMRTLAKKYKDTFEIDNLAQAAEEFLSPPEDIAVSEAYELYCEQNLVEIERLVELSRIAQNPQALNWLRATFFILSRSTDEWTLGDTAGLTNTQLNSILALIAKEANGGVEPQLFEPDEIEGTEVGDSEGKDEIGQASTGN